MLKSKFYAKQNQTFIDTDYPLLPTHFHLLNLTVAQELNQAFWYFESFSKALLKE